MFRISFERNVNFGDNGFHYTAVNTALTISRGEGVWGRRASKRGIATRLQAYSLPSRAGYFLRSKVTEVTIRAPECTQQQADLMGCWPYFVTPSEPGKREWFLETMTASVV